MVIHKKTFLNNLFLYLLVAICIFSPIYRYKKMIYIIALLIFWMLSTFVINTSWVKKAQFTIAYLIGMLALYLVLGFSNNAMTEYFLLGINQLPVYMWFLILEFYLERPDYLRQPLRLFFVLFLVTVAFTLVGNLRYPGASRLLAGTTAYYARERQLYREAYIGGYDIIYGAVFLMMPLTILAKKKKWLWCVIALLFATIVISSYTIAILLAIVMILCGILKPKHTWTLAVVFLILVLGISIFETAILNAVKELAALIDSEILERRITSLITGEYFEGFGDQNSRLTIYYNAILNWLDHPFFGKLLTENPVSRRSGHSTLLEYLNQFGLFSILFYSYIYRAYRITSKRLNGTLRMQCSIYFLFFFVFGMIDRYETFIGIGVCAFFAGPALFLLIQSNEGKSRYENNLAYQ